MSNKLAKRLTTAQSLAANFNSEATVIHLVDNVGYFIQTSGVTDNTGTFGVQVQAVKEAQESPWIDLTLSGVPTLADADAGFFINLNQLPPCRMRLTFTAAGTVPDGTAEIWVSGKEIGGK